MTLRTHDNVRHIGYFNAGGDKPRLGEVIFDRDQTTFTLWSEERKNRIPTHQILHGRFEDLTQATMVNSRPTKQSLRATRGQTAVATTYKPEYIALGAIELQSESRVVAIEVELSDFKVLKDSKPNTHIIYDADQTITDMKQADLLPSEFDAEHIYIRGWDDTATNLCESEELTITLSTTATDSHSITEGHTVTFSDPHAFIELNTACSFEGAMDHVFAVQRFFTIIFGRPQEFIDLKFFVNGQSSQETELQIYGTDFPKVDYSDDPPAPGWDLLIDPSSQNHEFTTLFAHWLSLHPSWRRSRGMATRSLSDPYYDNDRLVRAANSFDHIDNIVFGSKPDLTSPFREAYESSRTLFRGLPNSSLRDAALSALGRLSARTLRDKVNSRADIIKNVAPDQFQDLHTIAGEAVLCRNFFVHGTETKIDYTHRPDLVNFLTDTLEFVFAASDLIDCGWPMQQWLNQNHMGKHPFSMYLIAYRRLSQIIIELLDPPA